MELKLLVEPRILFFVAVDPRIPGLVATPCEKSGRSLVVGRDDVFCFGGSLRKDRLLDFTLILAEG